MTPGTNKYLYCSASNLKVTNLDSGPRIKVNIRQIEYSLMVISDQLAIVASIPIFRIYQNLETPPIRQEEESEIQFENRINILIINLI